MARLNEDSNDLLMKAQSVGVRKGKQTLEELRDEFKDFKLKAYGKRLILAQVEVESWVRTEGGIEMRREDGSIECKGLVIAVGEGIIGVNVGDVVHHGYHSGIVFGYGDVGLKTINDYEILAIEKHTSDIPVEKHSCINEVEIEDEE